MTRIDVILDAVRSELERRPQMLEGGGLRSVMVLMHFEGERWLPRRMTIRPEFEAPDPARARNSVK